MTESNLKTPSTIGVYRIDGQLGFGGMGEVYRGWDPDLERPVAIKLIRGDIPKDAAALERFRREALVVAQLDHPSIVRIHHIQKWADHPCLVMELVTGESLARVLTRGPIALKEVVPLLGQMASGLAAAHAKGIVHRDLKAQNVMLTPEGQAKILDFGIAKRLQGSDEPLSGTGAVIGTLHAMSPEQAAGKALDGRSDLFALGVLAYEMLSGVSPFRGETASETLARIISHHPQPVQALAPEVPSQLSKLIDRLLAKDPTDRPATAQGVSDWLEDWQAGTNSPEFYMDGEAEAIGRLGREQSYELPTLVAGRPLENDKTLAPGSSTHADGHRPSRSIPLRGNDSSGPNQRRTALIFASSALMVLVLIASCWIAMRPREPLTVAVIGLASEDLQAADWQTTAFEEGLILGLRDHDFLRALDGDSMAHLRRALGHPERLAIEELGGFRAAVSRELADVIVTGSWHRTEDSWNLALQLLESGSGQTQELSVSGDTSIEAVHSAVAVISETLGIKQFETEATISLLALLPTNPGVLRLYSEGLRARRSGELITARSRFKEALVLAPESPELHRSYAVASQALGFESDARRAADEALELAKQLPQSTGATIEAECYAILGKTQQAIATNKQIFEENPDEIHFAIEAARLQMLLADGQATLASVERLRPKARGLDAALLDLIEVRIHNDAGEFTLAKDLARRGALVGGDLGLLYLEAEGRLLEGVAHSHLGERDAAEESFDQAFLAFQKTGNFREALNALLENAFLLYEQGEAERALDYLQNYQQRFVERDDPWSTAMLENNMAVMRIYQGRLEEARSLLESAISVFKRRSDLLDLAQALLNLGAAHHLSGNLEEALAAYEQAEPLFVQFGDRPNLASVRINIGEIRQDVGDLAQAEVTYDEALALERELSRPSDISYALNRLGELALLRHEIEVARSRFEESLRLVEAIGDKSAIAHAQMGLARVELLASNAGNAESLAWSAKQKFLDVEDVPSAHRSEVVRARSLLQRTPPDLQLAKEIYEKVHLSSGQLEEWRLRVELELLAARLAVEHREDPERKVRSRLEALVSESESAGLVLDACAAGLALGEVEWAVGEIELGRQHLERMHRTALSNGWTGYAQRAARRLDI